MHDFDEANKFAMKNDDKPWCYQKMKISTYKKNYGGIVNDVKKKFNVTITQNWNYKDIKGKYFWWGKWHCHEEWWWSWELWSNQN